MQKVTVAAVAASMLGIVCVTAVPALAQLPGKNAPAGMIEISAGKGVEGRILTSQMGGTTSARKMLQALKMISGEYFDKPLMVTRAFSDRNDQNIQAAFTARLKGVPVRGVASVVLQGETGQGTLLFDEAKGFTKSFHALTARQKGGGIRPDTAPNVTLTPQAAPDGSGQISLPPGFHITGAYKGTLDIAGPDGAAMVMGAPTICTRREAAGMFPGLPTVDFNDPVRAMVDYVNYMGRKSEVAVAVKVLDARPVSGFTGRAAYIRYSVQAAGKSMEGFGLFSVSATDTNQALFYQSFISAPTPVYRKAFPGMLRAWGTWSVNPQVFTERLMAAAQSMRGISDIITSVNDNRQQVYARVNEAWSDYIRDQSTWNDPVTNTNHKVSNAVTNGGGIPMINGVPLQPVSVNGL